MMASNARSAPPTRKSASAAKRKFTSPDTATVQAILKGLKKLHPVADCALNHRNPFELAVATILSAQCTDVRVNMVTPALFKRFPTPADLSHAEPVEVEKLIHSTGFYKNKTKSLIGLAQALMEHHGGKIPRTMEILHGLPGIGRKTANVILGTAFGIAEGVVVDTHVKRITNRLGLTCNSDPVKIERDLVSLLPKSEWIGFSHRVILHGRQLCDARKPDCEGCLLKAHCPFGQSALVNPFRQTRSAATSSRRKKK